MEEIKELLVSMQQEIRQQKAEMSEMKEDIKNTINNNINEKFKNLEIKNEVLEKKIQEQSDKINNLERYIRRKNLVMFGVQEGEKTYYELERRILKILNTHFNVQYNSNNIEAVRRIGKKSEKARPVIISFSTIGLKLEIQKNSKCLRNTQYYIKEDYPLEVLNKRKELQSLLKKEKDLGKTAFIKYDKLIVLDNNKNTPRNYSHKRNLSESPEASNLNNQQDKQIIKQALKKNKPTNMKDFILQKPKLTVTHTHEDKEQPRFSQQDNS